MPLADMFFDAAFSIREYIDGGFDEVSEEVDKVLIVMDAIRRYIIATESPTPPSLVSYLEEIRKSILAIDTSDIESKCNAYDDELKQFRNRN